MALPIVNTYFTPFMAWNRLESRPRRTNYEDTLKAKVYDPLWMLSKQWQMGEYQGNDTGSGIFAKVQLSFNKISYVGNLNEAPFISPSMNISDEPLEPLVERITYNFSIKESILLWKKFIYFLNFQTGNNTLSNNLSSYLLTNSILVIPTDFDFLTSSLSNEEKIEISKVYSNKKLVEFIRVSSLKGSNINGGELYNDIISNSNSLFLGNNILKYDLANSGFTSTDIDAASTSFKNWVEKNYGYAVNAQIGSNEFWNKRTLSYEFDVYDENFTRYSSTKYSDGILDWHDFKQVNSLPSSVTSGTNPPLTIVKEMVMTENRFAGMPSSRWWEFENGGVNFCKLDANTTDLAKIVLTQFALVYQDDWFVIPYAIPKGTISEVDGVVVTDVFGIRTLVKSHNIEYDATNTEFVDKPSFWKDWSWMAVQQESNVINDLKPSSGMLLVNNTDRKMESKPFEKVTYVRDEMSNMVWAVEEIVPDNFGKGMDGQLNSKNLTEYLKLVSANTTVNPSPGISISDLQYQLMNTVPENWIPFIAKHIPLNNREVELQRASMPRIVEGLPTSLVRPVTSILKENNTSSNTLLINEEEVTKAGITVETSFQRMRWYNGKTYSWIGRRKRMGRGQGNSGLVFDSISGKEK